MLPVLELTGNCAEIDRKTGRRTSVPPAGTLPSEQEVERIRGWLVAGASAD